MKKKILIFISLFIGLFIFGDRVYACSVPSSPSSTLTTYCTNVCSSYASTSEIGNAYYYGLTEESCKTQCLEENAGLDNSCYCTNVNSSPDGFKCYVKGICGKSTDYSNTTYCKDHEQGENIDGLAKQQETAEANREAMRNRVCSAAAVGVQVDAVYNSCYTSLVNSNCKQEVDCKAVICQQATYSESAYCNANVRAETYLNGYSASQSTTSYTYNSSVNGTAAGTTGTIDDDLNYNTDNLTPENCYGFGEVIYYVTLIVKIFQIVAPIILIIWASIDLFKSVIAGDEKKIVEMRKPIMHRFIAAILVFLVPWIVNTIVSYFSSESEWLKCWKNNMYKDSSVNVVNVHDTSKETTKITNSCSFSCASTSNPDECKEACINSYWQYNYSCWNVTAEGGNNTEADIVGAREKCYSDFAEQFISSWNSNN